MSGPLCLLPILHGRSTFVGVSAERDEPRDAEAAALRLGAAPQSDRPWPSPWFGAAAGSRTGTAAQREPAEQ